MANIRVPSSPVRPAGDPHGVGNSPTQVRSAGLSCGESLATALEHIQNNFNTVFKILRSNTATAQQVLATNASGLVIAAVGGFSFSGVPVVNYFNGLSLDSSGAGFRYSGGAIQFSNDGSTWTNLVTGAAGSTKDIQFNSGGAFAADTGVFYYDSTVHSQFIVRGGSIPAALSTLLGGYGNWPLVIYANSPGGMIFVSDPNGSTNSQLLFISNSGSAANGGGVFQAFTSRGTLTTPTATQNADKLISIYGSGYDPTNTYGGSNGYDAGMFMFVDGTFTSTSHPTHISFFTTPVSSITATEAMRITPSGIILSGITSTDLSLSAGAIVSANSIATVTASVNASVGSFAAVASNYVALASSKTGSGTYLPLAFFTSATEALRITTGGIILSGLTSTDLSLSAGSIVSANALVSATASTNATIGSFAAVASNYVAISSTRTGSGAFQPMAFFTNAAERMRILTTGQVLINRTTDDGSGAVLQTSGSINVSSNYSAGGTAGITGTTTPVTSITYKGGLITAAS